MFKVEMDKKVLEKEIGGFETLGRQSSFIISLTLNLMAFQVKDVVQKDVGSNIIH